MLMQIRLRALSRRLSSGSTLISKLKLWNGELKLTPSPILKTSVCSCTTFDSEAYLYMYEEVELKSYDGTFIAGKLWSGKKDPDFKETIPPILCIHGWLDNAGTFDPLMPLILKPNMKVLAIDLPGHGYSPASQNKYYDPFMEGFFVLHKVLKYLKTPKVILMGHSLGALISFVLAGVFPEHVAGYVGIDTFRPFPRDQISSLRSITATMLNVEEKLSRNKGPPRYSYKEILERSYNGRGASVSLEGCKILLERGAQRMRDGKFSFRQDLRVSIPTLKGRFHKDDSLKLGLNIECPILVVKGEPGMDFEPREDFLKVIDEVRKGSKSKKVELHYVDGSHYIHLNSPEEVAPIINNFIWPDLRTN